MKLFSSHRRTTALILPVLIFSFLFLVGCQIEAPKDTVLPDDVFCVGITVNGINVGGMTMKQATEAVRSSIEKPQGVLVLTNGDKKAQIDAGKIVVQDNVDEVLGDAIKLGNTGTKKEIREARKKLEEEGISLPIEVAYNPEPLRADVSAAAESLSYPALDATATLNLALPEKFTFTSSQKGSNVNADELFALIQNAIEKKTFNNSIEAPAQVLEPAVSDESIRQNYALISSCTSYFKKSPYSEANRVFNITKAAGILNGIIINPGEEFDFNKTLGKRTPDNGWREAGAIVAGKKELETGGGICQVSSTIYNAVIRAELEVLERRPHTWPLSYLPIGLDATVSYGGPNFRFRNNMGTPVMIVAQIDKQAYSITVSIFGKARTDGIEVRFKSVQTSWIAQPADHIIRDDSLTPGTSIVERKGRGGSRSKTYKEYYKDGVLIKSELHHEDYYPPIASILYVGPTVVAPTIPPYMDVPSL